MNTPACLLRYADQLEAYYRRYYPALAPLAKPCFLSTVQTTMERLPDGAAFVITGDIPAMWLRDSSAQVKNYLPFAAEDETVRDLLRGVIATQAKDVLLDAYANAFNREANGLCYKVDKTERNPAVWERKYEVDSLCAPILLAESYEKAAGDTAIYTADFHRMLHRIAEVFRLEQRHERSAYSFEREDCPEQDTLPCNGRGTPVGYTGMTWSGFRPSDDRCEYGYLIPANMMAVMAMRAAARMAREKFGDEALAAECAALEKEMEAGIRQFGVVEIEGKQVYCYEADGLGHYKFMDDANSPSLLSAPYLGFCPADDPLYLRTRSLILSKKNPYYAAGACARGVGSPHTPEGYVWHIGITMQALTSTSREEILDCLAELAGTHAGCNLMHESFDPNDPARFTRADFAWANTLLASLMIHLMDERFFEQA